MKTLVTLLKIAMLVTTLSFVMSCDNKKKNTSANTNYAYNNGLYTNQNGYCINSQTGQQAPATYCQSQYNTGGYGQATCTGNGNYFVWGTPDQMCATQPSNSATHGYGCWKSCAYMNCSGQIACPGGGSTQYQTGTVQNSLCGYAQPVQCLQ